MTTDRVSVNMQRAAVVVGILAIAASLWYLQRDTSTIASNDRPQPPPLPAEPPPADPPEAPVTTIAKVTKLAPAERKRLAEAIASMQASRGAGSGPARGAVRAPAAPSLPAEAVEASRNATLKVEIRTAMKDVVPQLAACYEAEMDQLAEPSTKIVAELTLTGDPDIGTLIDAKQLADDRGKLLSATFDDCLRSTFQTLALPPLTEGDRVEVRYPFTFSKR
ncbi:MAG TPA: hypothetical protein VIV11_15240 [Kofleriaceae bacterium]